MEIFDVFSMNRIENYPAAGEHLLINVILKVSQTLFQGFLPQGGGGMPPWIRQGGAYIFQGGGGAVKYPESPCFFFFSLQFFFIPYSPYLSFSSFNPLPPYHTSPFMWCGGVVVIRSPHDPEVPSSNPGKNNTSDFSIRDPLSLPSCDWYRIYLAMWWNSSVGRAADLIYTCQVRCHGFDSRCFPHI